MNRPPRNLAASIHRRLLNGARERGEDPQFILQRYAAEWSSQDSVDTPEQRLLSRFELFGADAA
jgi:hypothetical protein